MTIVNGVSSSQMGFQGKLLDQSQQKKVTKDAEFFSPPVKQLQNDIYDIKLTITKSSERPVQVPTEGEYSCGYSCACPYTAEYSCGYTCGYTCGAWYTCSAC
jgi:hypothetical protein